VPGGSHIVGHASRQGEPAGRRRAALLLSAARLAADLARGGTGGPGSSDGVEGGGVGSGAVRPVGGSGAQQWRQQIPALTLSARDDGGCVQCADEGGRRRRPRLGEGRVEALPDDGQLKLHEGQPTQRRAE